MNIHEKHIRHVRKLYNIRNSYERQLRILCTSIRGPRNLHINWMLHRRFLGGSQISNGYYTLTKVHLSKLHARCTRTLCSTWLIVPEVFMLCTGRVYGISNFCSLWKFSAFWEKYFMKCVHKMHVLIENWCTRECKSSTVQQWKYIKYSDT